MPKREELDSAGSTGGDNGVVAPVGAIVLRVLGWNSEPLENCGIKTVGVWVGVGASAKVEPANADGCVWAGEAPDGEAEEAW